MVSSDRAIASDEILTIDSDTYGSEIYTFTADGNMMKMNDRGIILNAKI